MMDPNATLRNINEFLDAKRDGVEVDYWCQDLWDWIAKGGFSPVWENYPLATHYYDCRKIGHDRGERVVEGQRGCAGI